MNPYRICLGCGVLEYSMMAEKWDRLNSAFRDPVDWSRIKYFAVSERYEENPQMAHLDTFHKEQQIKQLQERLRKYESE